MALFPWNYMQTLKCKVSVYFPETEFAVFTQFSEKNFHLIANVWLSCSGLHADSSTCTILFNLQWGQESCLKWSVWTSWRTAALKSLKSLIWPGQYLRCREVLFPFYLFGWRKTLLVTSTCPMPCGTVGTALLVLPRGWVLPLVLASLVTWFSFLLTHLHVCSN